MLETATNPHLLIFSDDWGRHPSSCQHLAHALKATHRIWWVNTIGTRRPRLDLATARRAIEKARHWSSGRGRGNGPGSSPASANPTVLNPRMWPSFGSRTERRINRELLCRQIAPVIERTGSPVVAITTIPIVADLVGLLPVDHWVYYCLDDYEEWPGLDRSTLRSMERELVGRVESLVAVSENLRAKFRSMGRDSDLLTHGTDLEHWTRAEEGRPPSILSGLEGPLVVFWGVVDRRMDVSFLERLSADLDGGTIVLVGPEADPDPALGRVPRLVKVGPVPYDDLPGVARVASVLVMPYGDLPVTRAMQPLKLKEYLATGRPVVVRDLPSTRPWGDALDLVDSPGAFSAAVRSRLDGVLPDAQSEARRRLAGESWASKAAEFERMALGAPMEASRP